MDYIRLVYKKHVERVILYAEEDNQYEHLMG